MYKRDEQAHKNKNSTFNSMRCRHKRLLRGPACLAYACTGTAQREGLGGGGGGGGGAFPPPPPPTFLQE